MAKRIGTGSGGGSKDKKRNRKAKVDFDIKTAEDADGKAIEGRAKGKLTAIPANWDVKTHKPLKKDAFDDDATYMEFRAGVIRAKGKLLIKAADKLENGAKKIRKFGTTDQRKRVNALLKRRESLQKLEAEMAEEGFDLEEIDSLMDTDEAADAGE